MKDKILESLKKGCRKHDGWTGEKCTPSRLCKDCGIRISQHKISTDAKEKEIDELNNYIEHLRKLNKEFGENELTVREEGRQEGKDAERKEELRFLESLPIARIRGNSEVYKVNVLVTQKINELKQQIKEGENNETNN